MGTILDLYGAKVIKSMTATNQCKFGEYESWYIDLYVFLSNFMTDIEVSFLICPDRLSNAPGKRSDLFGYN